MEWEIVETCNFCGGGSATPYHEAELGAWCGRPLQLLRCDGCGLVRASPRPLIQSLYRRQIDGDISAIEPLRRGFSRSGVAANHRRMVERVVEAAERPVRSLFDVGCGAGTLMMEAARLGIEAQGNDINAIAVDMLNDLGFRAHKAFTRELALDGRKFDAVMLLNYLTRSYTPFDDLGVCRELLHEDGVVCIHTPYLDCPQHRAAGGAWSVFGNDNVHYFNPETLAAMIAAAGFRVVDEDRGGWMVILAAAC